MPTVVREDGLTNEFSLQMPHKQPPLELSFTNGRAECDQITAEKLVPYMAANGFTFDDSPPAPEEVAAPPAEESPAPKAKATAKAPAAKKAPAKKGK